MWKGGCQQAPYRLCTPSLPDSSYQDSSGSEGPITYRGPTASEWPGLCAQWPRPPLLGRELTLVQGWVGAEGSFLRPEGAAGSQWVASPRVVAIVPSSAVAGTGQGSPGLHQKVLKGLGNPRSPISTASAPGLSCALALILPHQQRLFLFPAVFSQQPLLGGWGSRRRGRGFRSPPAVPLQGQAAPPAGRSPCNNGKCPTTVVTTPSLFLNCFVKPPPDWC